MKRSIRSGNRTRSIAPLVFACSLLLLLGAILTLHSSSRRPEQTVLTSEGASYRVTVAYGPETGLPADTALEVREILRSSDGSERPTEYARYRAEAAEALSTEASHLRYARFFDISLLSGGRHVQPAEGSVVEVEICLADPANADMRVIHFGEKREALKASARDGALRFHTTGFSVYAIVAAPAPFEPTVQTAASLEEFAAHTDEGYYLSLTRSSSPEYVSSALKSNGCFTLNADAASAAVWYFEPGEEGTFYIYTLMNQQKQYMLRRGTGNEMQLSPDGGTAFTLSEGDNGTFYIKTADADQWLQYSNGGGGVRLYQSNATAANCRFTLTYASSILPGDDYCQLDGKTYGIAYHNDTATAAGLSADSKTVSGQQRLQGIETLMRYDVLSNDGILLVAQGADIAEWTFELIEKDKYYITTGEGEGKKYLTISGGNLTLQSTPDPVGSVITAVPGTGAQSGKWQFSANGYAICMPGSESNGFNGATGSGDTTWMNLVRKTVLNDDDFRLYTAHKVSVSDTDSVYDKIGGDGQRKQSKVVIYTRVWNDTDKKYEFYAIDHDGSLVRCFDGGDTIQWTGSQVNTALWEFTEYHNSDGTPNYYYELQNVQYGNYLAPQLQNGQVTSGSPLGLNLNGRRYGENYTTIIAWDDYNYAYTGLKVENGRVVACPLSQAEDFYFAVIEEGEEQDHLTEVATVSNGQFGITMQMIDFNNANSNNTRDAVQNGFFGGDNNNPGLLSTDLGDSGYPTTTAITGHEASLSELFDNMTPVDHLFLQSIYNESGYFEYDSTQNFAHLNDDGNFTVYDQIGSIDGINEFKNTRTHGQFMPYNDLTEGEFGVATNITDVNGSELPDTHPRKGEKMYLIGHTADVDYFFGMEMSAQFTQTASGLDAWGHDIIFEFSGDDDFWFYVDGELVLDLGGVHSAMTGSINFRTGEVKSSRGNSTLYEIFKANYKKRNPNATNAEVNAYLDEIFSQNSDGQYVFKDYTNHEMKMFYMERGAGASNLHMRFNLAAVKPGTVMLSKKLSGTESQTNSLLEFPYQIRYKTTADGESAWHLLPETDDDGNYNVKYKDTITPVEYREHFTPAGGTAGYDHVFILRPDQFAEITMPDGVTVYEIVECGVNPDIYDSVQANGTELTGTETANGSRLDFPVPPASMEDRPEVQYVNHVKEGAMRDLSIKKVLYAEDGQTILTSAQDDTPFGFRLYLGTENAGADQLPLANMYRYHVKDAEGNYCFWDSAQQQFASLGKTEYADLTEEEKESATFYTSMNGSISKIPADHTVEVRELIIGTQYKVEERDYEIPRGYTLRLSDGYTRTDVDPVVMQPDPYASIMQADEDPKIEVRNQRGWGLSVKKVWTDADFMALHDEIYFAVYLDGELMEGTVRAISTSETEIYYYFEELAVSHSFSDYVIREVTLEHEQALTVDEDGFVSGYTSVTPIDEGGALLIGGQPVGGVYREDGYTYEVHYTTGDITGRNENVRVDTVINSRPGIELYKTDWQWDPLAGAVFTLKDDADKPVAAASYISGSDGLITIAYLSAGVYTVTEIETPEGYAALDAPLIITVGANNQISVSGVDPRFYTVSYDNPAMAATITLRNRPSELQVKKVDSQTRAPLENAHFALYPQVTDIDGNKRKDYLPLPGYEDLITNAEGILEEITLQLGRGTYYLTETAAPPGYDMLEEDLCFTIGADGKATIQSQEHSSWLTVSEDPESGQLSCLIAVPNGVHPVSVIVSGRKILQGRGMRQGEFTFSMTPVDSDGAAIGEAVTIVSSSSAAGESVSFRFPETVFDLYDYLNAVYRDEESNALFYYIVAEQVPAAADENGFDSSTGVTYDRNQFLVTITLKLDENELTAEKTITRYQGGAIAP